MMCNAVATTQTIRWDFQAISNIYIRFYFQMDTAPPASNTLLLLRSGASTAADMRVATDGTCILRNQASSIIDTSTTALTVDTWHRIELHCTASRWEGRLFTGTNLHGLIPDENEVAWGGTVTDTTFDNFAFGINTSATWLVWFDELKVRTDDWVGPAANYHKMQSLMGVA